MGIKHECGIKNHTRFGKKKLQLSKLEFKPKRSNQRNLWKSAVMLGLVLLRDECGAECSINPH